MKKPSFVEQIDPGDAFESFDGASGLINLKSISQLIEQQFDLQINLKVESFHPRNYWRHMI